MGEETAFEEAKAWRTARERNKGYSRLPRSRRRRCPFDDTTDPGVNLPRGPFDWPMTGDERVVPVLVTPLMYFPPVPTKE